MKLEWRSLENGRVLRGREMHSTEIHGIGGISIQD
jgi:hypothetical protein